VGALGLELIFTFKLAFTLDTPTLPEQLKRPEYGRSDKGKSTLSVKNLDKLTGLLSKVNENQFLKY
jgi:hypothetical protein